MPVLPQECCAGAVRGRSIEGSNSPRPIAMTAEIGKIHSIPLAELKCVSPNHHILLLTIRRTFTIPLRS
jgi:hypothetical protein